MGKSHQAGWVVLRGKKWYGYFRRRVLDPMTERERVDIRAAELLDLKPRRVLEMARAGQIPAYPLGTGSRKTWRFRLSEICAAISAGK